MLKEHFQEYFVAAEVANANGSGREYVVTGYGKTIERSGDCGELEITCPVSKGQLPLNSRDFCFLMKTRSEMGRYYPLKGARNLFF